MIIPVRVPPPGTTGGIDPALFCLASRVAAVKSLEVVYDVVA